MASPDRLVALAHGHRVVAQPDLGRRGFARLGEALGGVGADAVQHPVAGLAEHLRLDHHQRLVHQPRGQADHVLDGQRAVGADLLGHVQGPAGKHRQAAQQDLLGRGEQVMAPVDGGPQRPLPRRRGPVAGTQQREAVAQPGGDLLGGQHAHPGGGQLDGQRHAVQGAADVRHRHRVPLRDREAGPGRRRPVREQLGRLEAGQLRSVPGSVRGRHGERRDLPHGFLRDPQRLLAGGHDAQFRAARQQALAERGARVNQMLAVVEHDQRLPGLQGAGQRVLQRVPGLGLNADDGGHPGDDQVWLPQVAQFDR